jgi:hypothetical protein
VGEDRCLDRPGSRRRGLLGRQRIAIQQELELDQELCKE